VTAAAACPACGHEVSRDERQCPKCASAFALGSCPNCDQELPVSYLECPKCRAQFGPGSSWQIRRRAIRRNSEADFAAILAIINDAAQAYRGVIPKDRWHEPYMPADELAREIAAGVAFWVEEEDGRLQGVMGMQDKGEVALVRHAYVAPKAQRSGVGTRLLRHVQGLTEKPILIGTWMDASWAIDFYLRNGFALLTRGEIDRVLPRYWSIPARQIETSVVLADARWTRANA